MPTGLDGVALLTQESTLESTPGFSPFTNPLYDAVNIGFACPYCLVKLFAMTFSRAGLTVCVTAEDTLPVNVASPP